MSYKDDAQRLNAITPEFITETYGIPREGPRYKTDRPRALVMDGDQEVMSSVTRLGDLLDFGRIFKVFGNN